jgi:hypothetical protein
MFALLFITIAGAIIITISICIESLVSFIYQRLLGRPIAYSRLEWRANHSLHLQRLAHDGTSDKLEWTLGRWDIPITSQNTSMPLLDAEEGMALPRFLKPSFDVMDEDNVTQIDSVGSEMPQDEYRTSDATLPESGSRKSVEKVTAQCPDYEHIERVEPEETG